MKIEKAFILAAGLGTRMKPLTDTIPKPMVQVGKRSLLERTLDHLKDYGVSEVVINTHYKAQAIEEYVASYKDLNITLSHEDLLLDTAGGIANGMQHFSAAKADEDFFVLSGDGLWTDGAHEAALERLAEAWDPEAMDILMLLQPVSSFSLTEGVGDYDILPTGRAVRSLNRTGSHMFTSIRINSPRIFADAPAGAFSYLTLMDAAQQAGRLYGLEHDGEWHHISTLDDLMAVDTAFRSKGA
jgi:MurNAc alpha-1-phosphate uridylyltransferase